MDPQDLVTDETRDEERREQEARGRADRMPTPDEERSADSNEPDSDVAGHAKEMYEIGANVKGEGRIEP